MLILMFLGGFIAGIALLVGAVWCTLADDDARIARERAESRDWR